MSASPTRPPAPTAHPPIALTLVLALLAWTLVALASTARATGEGDPVQIDEGTLSWGVKFSWRGYAGQPILTGGAAQPDPWSASGGRVGGPFEFPIASGSYDPVTGTTEVVADGSVQWQKYPASEGQVPVPAGYTGSMDIFVLDVRVTDPAVTISPDGAYLTAEVVSRSLSTWELVDFGRVRLADLDVDGTTPTVAGGTTAWSGVTAALTQVAARDVWGGIYQTAQVVDPVSISYAGPGGVPVVTEETWTVPDSTSLSFGGLGVTSASLNPSVLWSEPDGDVVHVIRQSDAVDAKHYVQAYRLSTMSAVGTPLEVTAVQAGALAAGGTFATPDTHELYFSSLGAGGAAVTSSTSVDRVLRWRPGTQDYAVETLVQPFTVQGATGNLPWDAAAQRAVTFQRVVPGGAGSSDYEAHEWWLNTYTRAADGSFAEQRYRLPDAPTGYNREWWAVQGVAVAADGTLVVPHLANVRVQAGVTPAVVESFPALQVSLDPGAGTVSVRELAGTDAGQSTQAGYTQAFAGADGSVSLLRPGTSGRPGIVQQLRLDDAGELEKVGAQVVLPGAVLQVAAINTTVAVDEADGTLWAYGTDNQRLLGVRDGRLVHNEVQPRLSQFYGGVVVVDHDVYVATNGDEPVSTFSNKPFGFARLTWNGYSPTITSGPQDATVELSGASRELTLSASATGTPAPTVRWQRRAIGSLRFTDLAGESGPELVLDVTAATDGSQYRAVFTNSAGAVATLAATVTVHAAPILTRDLIDVTVVEGTDAVFDLVHVANPDPTVVWQRRDSGFWRAIDEQDDGLVVTADSLTVTDTNRDQSGALFRAKVTNAVGSTYSRAAKLTVNPETSIPAEGLDLTRVVLEWTGSDELQVAPPFGGSNYFSAGVSDGTEATYAATAGDVSVRQVSASGAETAASYATRADHVGNGGTQLVRLGGGDAEIAPDGSAVVTWDGAWSVNFYGGMAPFTLTDPELHVDADGAGVLSADLAGYASSQANPGVKTPLPPVAGVTVARFAEVEIDPAGRLVASPAYEGIELTVPEGQAPQDRSRPGWGSWPQEFVDFQFATGLASYWYSSGGAADARKAPDPVVVDFTDARTDPGAPPSATSTTRVTLAERSHPYGGRATATVVVTAPGAATAPAGRVTLTVAGRTLSGSLAPGASGSIAVITLPRALRPGRHPVTARFPGQAGITASAGATALRVTRATPAVRLRLVRTRVGPSARAKAIVTVTVPGASRVAATGQLLIRDGRRIVAATALRSRHRGKVTIRLPRLAPGKHRLRASIGGTPLQASRTSAVRTLTVG